MRRYTIRPTSVGVLSRGKDYSVRDLGGSTAGYTKMLEKELGVSLNADAPQTRWTQLHELSHVRHSLWSPTRVARYIRKRHGIAIDEMMVLAAEDARINEILRRRVPDCNEGFVPGAPERYRRDYAGFIASHAGPPAVAEIIAPTVPQELQDAVAPYLRAIETAKTADLTILKTTVPLAIAAHKALQKAAEPKPEPTKDEGGEEEGPGEGGPGEPSEDDGGPGEPGPEPGEEEEGPGDSEPDAGEPAGEEEGEDGPEAPGEGEGSDGAAGEEEGPAPAGDGDDAPGEPDGAKADGEPSKGGEPDGPTGGDDEAPRDPSEPDTEPVDTKEDQKALGRPDKDPVSCDIGKDDSAGGPMPWIMPQVWEPPLTLPHTLGAACVTTAETGNVIRWSQLYRLDVDGVIFRRARRRPGALQQGTVLIDNSGSMGLSIEDLDAMVSLLPHATIAVYSGRPEYGDAHIVIVARNGRRVQSLSGLLPGGADMGGGNCCDGPALLWLSRQPGPRLWICDGGVTGSGDHQQDGMRAECDAIMQAGQIRQLSVRDGSWRVTRELHVRRMDWNVDAFREALRAIELGRA